MISLREFILRELIPKMPLYEQAKNRANFTSNLIHELSPLLSYWALIEYAHGDFEGNESYEQYVEHWKKELYGWCDTLAMIKIKGGKRENAIAYALIDTEEINDPEHVYNRIKRKFNNEGINILETKKVAKYLADNCYELVKAISDINYDEWIEEL